MNDFAAWAHEIKALHDSLERLRALAEPLGVASPCGKNGANNEWFALLEQKLLPQVRGEPWLVAAIVGGTNIGKSLIFNQLAGEEASAVSPLAAGTRHPVCLVPQGFA
ncbi:MAG: 50S ribosome-binding GTPase, partial [Chloroflexi bacterium]|nr:50S ribosome-binding GTPase [Chloroflexota bacterium]